MTRRRRKQVKKRVDFGTPLLLIILIITAGIFCYQCYGYRYYDESQTLDFLEFCRYEERYGLEVEDIDSSYLSDFLTIPDKKGDTPICYINCRILSMTPIRHVLLPSSTSEIKNVSRNAIQKAKMYTDSTYIQDLCLKEGFEVGTAAEYYILLEEQQNEGFSLEDFKEIASAKIHRLINNLWFLLIFGAGFAGIIWLCAKLREKSGRINPLTAMFHSNFIFGLFLLAVVLGAFITFYFVLCDNISGFATDELMETLTGWPLKVMIGMLAVVLLFDLFHRDFIPWFFARVYIRVVILGVACGITAIIALFLGAISDQIQFIIQLFLAAPTILLYLLLGLGGCFILGPFIMGFKSSPNTEKDLSAGQEYSYRPSNKPEFMVDMENGGTKTVHNRGYALYVGNDELISYDPETGEGVGASGTRYRKY